MAPFSFFPDPALEDGEVALRLQETAASAPELGGVPVYRFAIVRRADGRTVGRCELRVGFSETLYYAGNIGYSVDKPERGHGYAKRACLLLLQLARRHRMPQVVITCRPDNAPSRRICESLGARLRDREECRYVLTFDEYR